MADPMTQGYYIVYSNPIFLCYFLLKPKVFFISEQLRKLKNKLQVYFILNKISYMLAKVIEIAQKHQALKFLSLRENCSLMIEKRPGSKEVTQQIANDFQGKASIGLSSEKIQAINKELKEIQNFDGQITQDLGIGDKFGDYGNLKNVFDEETTHLHHQKDLVLLIDVWATWCGPCQKPMQHNQDMLIKNESTWKGKVKIIGVSVDDEKEVIKERVTSKGWTNIQHLTLQGWKQDHKLIKDFNISGIPFVCLVDKAGVINYIGHPNQIPLEARINELISQSLEIKQSQKSTEEQVKIQKSSNIANDQSEQFFKIVSKQNIEKEFGNEQLFSFVATLQKMHIKGKGSLKITIKVSTYEDRQDLIDKFKKLLSGIEGIDFNVNLVKFVEVPRVEQPHCWECAQPLQYPYYWLKWEEGVKFGCKKCIESRYEGENKSFKYSSNSILLKANWNRIAVKSLGNNIQPTNANTNANNTVNRHNFYCNGCSKGPKEGQARYICLACRADPNYYGDYIDSCEDCKQNYQNGDNLVVQSLDQNGHTKDHPWLRILYNVHGYYQF